MKMKKRFSGILLSLLIMIGFVLGMSLTAYADDPYAGLKNTTNVIKFDGKDWYLIDYDDTTVTLLSKECVCTAAYNDSDGNNSRYVDYADSTVKTVVDNWYKDNISTDAKTAVNGDMFLLTKEQVKENQETYKIAKEVLKCSRPAGLPEGASNVWWLCSRAINKVTITSSENEAVVVRSDDGVVDYFGGRVHYMFGVRPALKLNLSSVIFSSESNTFLIKKDVTGVSLNKPEITLNVNDTKTLTAEIEPADTEITATDKTVTWESSNTNIASVDSNGKITGVSEGEAIITVTTREGSFTDTCKVTVKKDVCTITFDPNGGKGEMDDQTVDKSVKTKLNKNEFTRSGYSFDSWNTDPDGDGTKYDDKDDITVEKNTTLYAQWKKDKDKDDDDDDDSHEENHSSTPSKPSWTPEMAAATIAAEKAANQQQAAIQLKDVTTKLTALASLTPAEKASYAKTGLDLVMTKVSIIDANTAKLLVANNKIPYNVKIMFGQSEVTITIPAGFNFKPFIKADGTMNIHEVLWSIISGKTNKR